MKKLLMINPGIFENSRSKDAMEPLAFAALAAHTPEGWDIEFQDERIEKLELDGDADLAALSVQTFTARRAYRIAKILRDRNIPVLMGGVHASLMPEEVMEHADCVVTGDAENCWAGVLEDAERGKLQQVYNSGPVKDPSLIRFDRRIFRGKHYSLLKPVQTIRGCRYSCSFCSVHKLFGDSIIQRDPAEVVREIQGLKASFLFFVDDNLFISLEKTRPLLIALKNIKRRWTCQISIDAAMDNELLDLLADAGCIAVFVGFESMDERNLKELQKSGNLRFSDYSEAVKSFRSRGIMVCGSFVFGSSYDSKESIFQTLDFSLKEKLCLCHFNVLFPTPGTVLYKNMEIENRLIYKKWWLDSEFRYGNAAFRPEGITTEELSYYTFKARKEFNRYSNIASRALDFQANSRNPTHLAAFLLSNLASRKEIHKKQGQALG
jgi:radical SAM superfamily enzyme YgiQ (UPF0313 family)